MFHLKSKIMALIIIVTCLVTTAAIYYLRGSLRSEPRNEPRSEPLPHQPAEKKTHKVVSRRDLVVSRRDYHRNNTDTSTTNDSQHGGKKYKNSLSHKKYQERKKNK